MARPRTGDGLRTWPSARGRSWRLVAKADAETAAQLGVGLDQLQAVARRLGGVGKHSDGSDAFQWSHLLRALGRLPEPRETASHRGGAASRRRAMKAGEGR